MQRGVLARPGLVDRASSSPIIRFLADKSAFTHDLSFAEEKNPNSQNLMRAKVLSAEGFDISPIDRRVRPRKNAKAQSIRLAFVGSSGFVDSKNDLAQDVCVFQFREFIGDVIVKRDCDEIHECANARGEHFARGIKHAKGD